jgi:hypothetical protein
MNRTCQLLSVLSLSALFAGACGSPMRHSPEAEWRRGQCQQILDEKMREKCEERVDVEYGKR